MEHDGYTDEQLFSFLKKDDEAAFDAIYERYWERLYRYAYQRVDPGDNAFEMTQDIFVSLWARRKEIQLHTSLSGYLFNSMRHQIIKHIKHSRVKTRYIENYNLFRVTSENSNEESLMLHELEESLEQNISTLPSRCQEIFRMSRYEQRSIKEIAEQLNISTRTVENQLTRALKHLRFGLRDFIVVAFFLLIMSS